MSEARERMSLIGVVKRAWWWAVPIGTALFSWLPYIGWNLLGNASPAQGWWRIPVVTTGLFDTYVYFHWLGAAALGLPYGGHLKWFGSVLVFLWGIIGSWASIPELWIVSRWITFTLTIWIGAWAVQRMSGLPRAQSRLLAIGFFGAVVVTLGMRPGVYAWYLPFCILGLACVHFVWRSLAQDAWTRSTILSLAALALTWLYPWFFMLAGVWLAVLWADRLIRLRRWSLFALFAVSIIAVWIAAVPLANWFLDPAQAGLIGMYERNGMAFARVPFFANTVIAICSWIVFLVLMARRAAPDSKARRRFFFFGTAWITMLLLWFHTPFTGLHTYSDHFIAPVTVLAWLSLGAVWTWARERGEGEREPVCLFRILPLMIALGATAFFIYVLQQPLRFNVYKFGSYVIHLAHWFALAAGAWFAIWRFHRPSAALSDRLAGITVLVIAFLVGLGGLVPAFIFDLPTVRAAMEKESVVDWIRANVPPEDAMCADPETASFYAAHTGRRVTPAEATLSWPDASEEVIRHLETLVGAYDVEASGSTSEFRFYTDHYRTIPCTDESQYSHNAPYARILAALGFSEERIDEYIGCDQETLDKNRARVDAAIEAYALDTEAFRLLCPWVIVPDAEASYWQLPADYVDGRITDNLSIWRTP